MRVLRSCLKQPAVRNEQRLGYKQEGILSFPWVTGVVELCKVAAMMCKGWHKNKEEARNEG